MQFVQCHQHSIPDHKLSRTSLSKVIIIPTYWCDQNFIESPGTHRFTPDNEVPVFLRSVSRISARTLYWNCGVAGTLWHILLAADCGDVSVLVPFDTVSHSILLQRLQSTFGICDNVHRWFQSYLNGRKQHVRRGSARSSTNYLVCAATACHRDLC